ncbi:MAG: TRAP transporter substrate-binding protein DctP [Flavobacteriaceae bacterium]
MFKQSNWKRISAAALTGLVAAVVAGGAQALELKLSDQFPAGHTITKGGTKAFFDHIQAHPEADLSVAHFPAEQLGKAATMLDQVQNRVADIAVVGMSYVPEKMPLSTMMELPGLYTSSFDGYVPYAQLAKEDLSGLEYDRHKVKLLWVIVTPPYQLLFKRKESVTDIAQLNGVKTRVAGATAELAAKSLGMVPVKVAAPDLYVALERGTLDAAVYTLSVMRAYKLDEVTESYTDNASMGGVGFAAFINVDVWNSLSPEQQKVITEASDAAGFATACAMMKSDLEAQAYLKEKGKNVYSLSEPVLAAFSERLSSVEKAWTEQLGARNLPATDTIEKFKKLQKQARDDGSVKAAHDKCLGS